MTPGLEIVGVVCYSNYTGLKKLPNHFPDRCANRFCKNGSLCNERDRDLAMEANKKVPSNFFEETCQKILFEHLDAIGVAYKVLDCGCSLLCGVSAQGDPLGVLLHVSGQPLKKGKRTPICLKCKLDNGLKRVVWEGIYWPGDEREHPDKELRLMIGRKVFGAGYFEPD